jgi:hypothetical protein
VAKWTTVKVHNDGDRQISFVLEPWGEICRIDPKSFLQIMIQGALDDPIEISTSGNQLVCWPPGGSTVRVLSAQGQVLGEAGGSRSPTQ